MYPAPGARLPPALLPPAFRWLLLGWLLSALATFVLPFLAFFLTARGLPPGEVGLLVSAFGAGGLASGPLSGALADRLGRRPTLLLSLILSAASAAALAFLDGPAAIGAAVLLFGLSSQAVGAPFQALLADLVPGPARPRAFALAHWARNLGVSLSLLAGGALAARGWALPFLLDAATTLLFALVVLLRVPEGRPAAPPAPGPHLGYGAVLRHRRFAALLGLHLPVAAVLWQLHAGLPIDLARRGLGPGPFGAVLLVNTGLVALLQPFSHRLTGRFPAPAVLAAGAALVGLGAGGYALGQGPVGFGLASALLTLGEIGYLPVAAALAAELAPPGLRGRYAGALGLSFGAAGFAAPALGSALLGAGGPSALWGGCLLLGLGAGAGFVALGPARPAPDPG